MEERLAKKQRNDNCNNSNLDIEDNMLLRHNENEHNKTH